MQCSELSEPYEAVFGGAGDELTMFPGEDEGKSAKQVSLQSILAISLSGDGCFPARPHTGMAFLTCNLLHVECFSV